MKKCIFKLLDWLKQKSFYKIVFRIIRRSNNKSLGYLRVIIKKLDYLKSMGVDTIWLAQVFESQKLKIDFNRFDFHDIDPLAGNKDDLNELIFKARQKNIKIILE